MADLVDRVLKCVECGAEFVFSASEQQFYQEKNFRNEPRRCKTCKSRRTESRDRGRGAGAGGPRGETAATCSQCGRQTTLPFKPTQGRPVYCRECFQQRRAAGAG